MKSICVFCGSSKGENPIYAVSAQAVGRYLAQNGIRLIYGGGAIGLMGEVADSALEAGGQVIGVITKSLMHKEVGHQGLTELHIVDTMHERKALMVSLADAFIALPGGFGTFDELFEVLTWRQLGIHNKPIGVLNVEEYFDCLLAFADHMVTEKFVHSAHREMLKVADEISVLLKLMQNSDAPDVEKWV